MPSIRRSFKLKAFSSQELYACPTGKSASLSVAILAPKKATVFVQKAALAADLSLSAPTTYTPVATPDVFASDINLSLSTSGGHFYRVADNTQIETATDHIGFRYQVLATPSGIGDPTPYQDLIPANNATARIRSRPILDYRADPKLSNGALIYDSAFGGTKFFRGGAGQSQLDVIRGASTPYSTNNITRVEAGGVIYGDSETSAAALSIDKNGYSSWWHNNISGQNQGANANYTSQPGSNSSYGIAGAVSRQIVVGSPQLFWQGNDPYFWCSSWSSGATPYAARILWSQVRAGNYSSWDAPQQTFNGAVNGEKLYWHRYAGNHSTGEARHLMGSSTNSIYYSPSTGFGGTTYNKLTDVPSDVNAQFPPIQFAENKLAFASLSGTGYYIFTVTLIGGIGQWQFVDFSQINEIRNLYGYVEQPELSTLIAESGLNFVSQESIGAHPANKRLYTLQSSYDVIYPFQNRADNADLVAGIGSNIERTNIVLEAGDRLLVHSEGTDTIAHVYGFEE